MKQIKKIIIGDCSFLHSNDFNATSSDIRLMCPFICSNFKDDIECTDY